MRVFIVDEKDAEKWDISAAKEFGNIVPIIKEGSDRCSIYDTYRWCENISQALSQLDFNPKDDCLLLIGSHVTLSIAMSVFIKQYGECKVLIYSRQNKSYIIKTLGKECE